MVFCKLKKFIPIIAVAVDVLPDCLVEESVAVDSFITGLFGINSVDTDTVFLDFVVESVELDSVVAYLIFSQHLVSYHSPLLGAK